MDTLQQYSRRRLQIIADADPGAIARVVEPFQNLNIVPRRVTVELSSNEIFHIMIDVCGILDEQLRIIVGKISQAPCVINAYWHRLD